MVLAGLMASSVEAQDVSFGVRSRYNGIPGAGSNIVFYNLPASGSIYAAPVNSSFDLVAMVSGGAGATQTASAFGLIGTVSGTDQVTFNPPPSVGDANNLGNATNPAFPVNGSFDLRFANTDIQSGVDNNREIDIVALEETGLLNNTITNGDGIAAIPVRIAAGATGTYNVAFNLSTNYTGFVKTISQSQTEFLTNPTAFPHVGGTIEVRRSRKGDLNGDQAINFADIGGFVSTLSSIDTFKNNFPWLQAEYISDINEDGPTNFADIGGFVALLANPPPSPVAVPEPGSVSLVVAGAIGLLTIGRRRLGRRVGLR
jgi:hypothetical protein